MRLSRLIVLVVVLAGMALVLPAALAKGPPNRVIITGPDIEGEIVITEERLLHWMAIGNLEDAFSGDIDAPEDMGKADGYEIARQFEIAGGSYMTFDRIMYYPHPDGELGYVHYLGVESGSSEYDGQWFHITPEGEAILTALLLRADETVCAV